MWIVQIFNVECNEMECFCIINCEYIQVNLNVILYYVIFFLVVDIIVVVLLGLMVWWGVQDVICVGGVILGVLVVFLIYLNMLFCFI